MWTALGSVATALAAVFAAVSAYTSLKATREMEAELDASQRAAAYQLLESFEESYRSQYASIMSELGPWPDPDEEQVEPALRRVVHDLLVSLCSVYRSARNGLIPAGEADYVATLFAEWLQNPNAMRVWKSVFSNQSSWPEGFAEYVDELLARPSPWQSAESR